MSHKQAMEKLVSEAQSLIDLKRYDVLAVFFANYSSQLIDRGGDLDRLYDENQRLAAIVNLIDMAKERDELRERVAALEAGIDGETASDESLTKL